MLLCHFQNLKKLPFFLSFEKKINNKAKDLLDTKIQKLDSWLHDIKNSIYV